MNGSVRLSIVHLVRGTVHIRQAGGRLTGVQTAHRQVLIEHCDVGADLSLSRRPATDRVSTCHRGPPPTHAGRPSVVQLDPSF